jgi:hypothetical protein
MVMASLLLNYTFDNESVSSTGNRFPVSFSGVQVVNGPGDTAMGSYASALDLGTSGKAAVNVRELKTDNRKFCLRICFQVSGPVRGRQNIVESTFLPFAIFANKGSTDNRFELIATVNNRAHGWAGPDTHFKKTLTTGKWYTATLAYDVDTAALFIDDSIVAVHAFPRGAMKKNQTGKLFFGTWVDGRRNHLRGKLAGFQWYKGIPEDIESRLDERRSEAEWFITYKYEAIKKKLNLGNVVKRLAYDRATGAYIQHYQRGAIMYHDSVGAAFEIHGAIYNTFKSMRNKSQLGYLVSDEVDAARRGGKKSVFSRGAIYWSPHTPAVPVLDKIYLEYENLGESRTFGFPVSAARNVTNGKEQKFQGCRMYHKNGEDFAREVHGAILKRFLAIGGVRKWGYPVSNESDVKNGSRISGKYSEFEGCTIYWSGHSGAFEVHGDIRRKYQDIKGPLSDLGFPISNEVDIPGVSGAGRMSCFEKGSILWYGNWSSIIIARPFKVYIGRINSRESEGFLMGQNDLYCYIKLKQGSRNLYSKRHPRHGDWGGRNIKNVNFTIPNIITPNNPRLVATFSVDVREADPGKDDHLGVYSKKLNAANAWGLKERNGVFSSGSFRKIRDITASVKPQVDPRSLSEPEKFWGVSNRGTPHVTWQQHASAFRDIDSETEWWDVTDWLDKAFYELVTEDLTDGGNCFGMSLEAIYARKGKSLFGLPLNRFTNWNTVRNEFNIKHLFQVGAAPIWWFVGQFISGNTHDPVDVFNRTHHEHSRGNNPVLCISQNYDFSGAPHCILPVGWHKNGSNWTMDICDPNFPNQLKQLTVNSSRNTFRYVSSSSRIYQGGEWSGGRMHYMPFCKLDEDPRTPLWDAILLILAGTIIILGDDAETTTITDANGKDLDAYGRRATNRLKSGGHLDEYFVGFKGFDAIRPGRVSVTKAVRRPTSVKKAVRRPAVIQKHRSKGMIAGEFHLRTEQAFEQGQVGVDSFAHLPMAALLADRRVRTLASALSAQPAVKRLLADRSVHHILNDPETMASMPRAVTNHLNKIATANANRNIIHNVRGVRRGNLSYAAKHKLSEFELSSALNKNELHKLAVNDLGTSKNTVSMESARDKLVKLRVTNKLGVKDDRIEVVVDRIPVGAARMLDMNLKPGLGGLELVTAAERVNARVTVNAKIGGQVIKRNFNLPLEGGARVKLSSLLSDNQVSVAKIDRVFGTVLSSKVIRGRG